MERVHLIIHLFICIMKLDLDILYQLEDLK